MNDIVYLTSTFFALFFLFLIAELWISPSSANGLYFGRDINITNQNHSFAMIPKQVAVTNDGNVYVVWVDDNQVYFSSHRDNETKFSPPSLLSEAYRLSTSPQIAATEKGNVYVVWVDYTGSDSNIEFRSSSDAGKTFDRKKEIRGTNILSFSPQIAATEKGNVYVVWVDKNSSSGDSNIVFRSSSDAGKTFDRKKDIRATNILSFSPQIAATEKGNVYVVWVDKNSSSGDSNIEFRSSSDAGKTFDRKKEIRGTNILSFSPQIAATEKGNVYVVWVDKNSSSGDSNIEFRSSSDAGKTFDRKKEIRGTNILSFSPQIAATEKGNVYVVWVDKNSSSGDSNIVFRSSVNTGDSFSRRVYLNKDPNDITSSVFPRIAATNKGNAYVTWVENNSLQLKQILDNGNFFAQTITLNKRTAKSWLPEMSVTEKGNVYVVWVQNEGITKYDELLFKKISEIYFDRNH